jgi:hypothetical protein
MILFIFKLSRVFFRKLKFCISQIHNAFSTPMKTSPMTTEKCRRRHIIHIRVTHKMFGYIYRVVLFTFLHFPPSPCDQ